MFVGASMHAVLCAILWGVGGGGGGGGGDWLFHRYLRNLLLVYYLPGLSMR